MNSDIAQLLYGIKVNIAAIENGDRTPQLFTEVRRDCIQMLELMKLFLISQRDSYYGYFLMNLSYEVDFTSRSIAGILLGRFPPVFHTNPLLLCKFSLREILFIVCHEIDHIVLNHPAEMLKANPQGDPAVFEKFNLAADASVNDRILQEMEDAERAFLAVPKGIISSEVLRRMFKLRYLESLESYLYYIERIRDKAGPPNAQQPQRMLGDGAKDADSTSEDAGENAGGMSDEDGNDGNIITAQNCGKPEDHTWDAGEDAEEAAAAVRELVNSATAIMNDEARGMIPGSFFEQVKVLNTPPALSWQSILKKYVGTITSSKRKTRTRLNRRQPTRFDLSGTRDEKTLKIVVAIDTSASVTADDVAKILREVLAILARRKHVLTVIECDSKVQRVYQLKSANDIPTSVPGRGGTAFTPVIEYVNNDRYFRDALLIYFTDGYGEREIPRPKTYRNLWVILGDPEDLSLKEPYGTVISF